MPRTSTTRPKGNGASIHGGAKGAGAPPFTAATQPPAMHKSAGHEARAAYLAKLAAKQDKALDVLERAMDLALEAEDAAMVNTGLRAAQHVTEALHGRPTQAITGEEGGPLTVAIRRIVDTGDDA